MGNHQQQPHLHSDSPHASELTDDTDTESVSDDTDSSKYLPFDQWSRHLCRDGTGTRACSLENHAVCLSNNHQDIIIIDHGDLIFVDATTFRIKTKCINRTKQTRHIRLPGRYPSIKQDPYNPTLLHIIGGSLNHQIGILNMESGDIETIHSFNFPLCAPVLICLHTQWLLFHSDIPIHSYDVAMKGTHQSICGYIRNYVQNMFVPRDVITVCAAYLHVKQWKNTNIAIPDTPVQFSGILSLDQRFVILIGGLGSDKIYIFNVEHKTWTLSGVICPGIWISNAVMTDAGDIHLFQFDKHWIMSIFEIVPDWQCLDCLVLNASVRRQCNECGESRIHMHSI
eukprot:337110_1